MTDKPLVSDDDSKFNATETDTITIDDCFNEFKRQELLDEDNKWYCSKCKEHVQATKQLEIFKVPPILIINLKRFKQSKQSARYMGMFTGGGAGSKIDIDVDFPLDGLDMSKYVTTNTDGKSYIYDCYAVSNHYGNMGFGHYTAYGKNPLTDVWYEFDDSRVSTINKESVKEQVVSGAAYNLFYRRRDWHENNKKEGLAYDEIAMKPDMDLITKKQ